MRASERLAACRDTTAGGLLELTDSYYSPERIYGRSEAPVLLPRFPCKVRWHNDIFLLTGLDR